MLGIPTDAAASRQAGAYQAERLSLTVQGINKTTTCCWDHKDYYVYPTMNNDKTNSSLFNQQVIETSYYLHHYSWLNKPFIVTIISSFFETDNDR